MMLFFVIFLVFFKAVFLLYININSNLKNILCIIGLKRPDARVSNENLNNIDFIFEDSATRNMEFNENHPYDNAKTTANSIDSGDLSTSLDEEQSQRLRPKKSKPLATHNPKIFNVVLAGKLYEEKKKLRMEQLIKKEREQRIFHAKPAPDFNYIHAHQKRAPEEPKYTIPTTPNVVHHHRKNMEKTKAKVSYFH